MKLFRIFILIAMVAFLATVTGCCGGTDTVVVEKQMTAPPVSVGDELLKLNDAKEKGVLTTEEFESAKKKLLESK
jgi:hypothetical protein